MFNLLGLPDDIISDIVLKKLDSRSLGRVMCVSRRLRDLTQMQGIWLNLLRTNFTIDYNETIPTLPPQILQDLKKKLTEFKNLFGFTLTSEQFNGATPYDLFMLLEHINRNITLPIALIIDRHLRHFSARYDLAIKLAREFVISQHAGRIDIDLDVSTVDIGLDINPWEYLHNNPNSQEMIIKNYGKDDFKLNLIVKPKDLSQSDHLNTRETDAFYPIQPSSNSITITINPEDILPRSSHYSTLNMRLHTVSGLEELYLVRLKNSSGNYNIISLDQTAEDYYPISFSLNRLDGGYCNFINQGFKLYYTARMLLDAVEDLNFCQTHKSNTANLNSQIYYFLRYLVESNAYNYRKKLWHWVELSKAEEGMKVAPQAAWAISLLNAGGEIFSDRDLRGIRVPSADLTGAVFTNSDLTGAVLNGAILVQANLDNTNLTRASLETVTLTRRLDHASIVNYNSMCKGILPKFIDEQTEEHIFNIKQLICSPDGCLLVSVATNIGIEGYKLCFWAMDSGHLHGSVRLKEYFDSVDKLGPFFGSEFVIFSPDSKLLAYKEVTDNPQKDLPQGERINVFDLKSWDTIVSFEYHGQFGQFGKIKCGNVTFSADSKTMSLLIYNECIKKYSIEIIDLCSSKIIANNFIGEKIDKYFYSHATKNRLIFTDGNNIKIINSLSGEITKTLTFGTSNRLVDSYEGYNLSPDNRYFVLDGGCANDSVLLLDTTTCNAIPIKLPDSQGVCLATFNQNNTLLAFNQNSTLLAFVRSSWLLIYNISSKKIQQRMHFIAPISCVEFDCQDRLVAFCSSMTLGQKRYSEISVFSPQQTLQGIHYILSWRKIHQDNLGKIHQDNLGSFYADNREGDVICHEANINEAHLNMRDTLLMRKLGAKNESCSSHIPSSVGFFGSSFCSSFNFAPPYVPALSSPSPSVPSPLSTEQQENPSHCTTQ